MLFLKSCCLKLNCSLTQRAFSLISYRSITELSDLPDTSYQDNYETDFGEGMKLVLDAVHPDFTAPEKGDWIPTHLIPFRGSSLKRRPISSLSPRTSSSSSRGLDGRQ